MHVITKLRNSYLVISSNIILFALFIHTFIIYNKLDITIKTGYHNNVPN